MKFDANKGDRGRIYDADGVAISYAISGDTETGVVLYAVVRGGAFVEKNGRILKACRRFKAPLRWEQIPSDTPARTFAEGELPDSRK